MRRFSASLIVMLLSACGGGGADADKGGSNGTQPPGVPPVQTAPQQASFAVAYGDTGRDAAVGAMVAVELQGTTADRVTRATIDGTQVDFVAADGRVLLPTVTLAAGPHVVGIEVGTEKVEKPLALKATALPTAPAAYLDSMILAVQADVAARLSGTTGEELANLQALQAELLAQRAAIASLDEKSARELALLIRANLDGNAMPVAGAPRLLAGVTTNAGTTGYDEAACQGVGERLAATTKAAAATALVAAAIPHPVAKSIGAGVVLGFTYHVVSEIEEAVRTCVPEGDTLTTREVATKAPVMALEFSYDVAGEYLLRAQGKLSGIIGDDTIERVRQLGGTVARVARVANRLINAIPARIIKRLSEFERNQEVAAQARRYHVTNISDPTIEGALSEAEDLASFRFRFRDGQMARTPVNFTFDIARNSDGRVVESYTARLAPVSMPVAIAQSLSASPGLPLSGALKAYGADTFEITKQPESGVLNLYNVVDGKFTYTVNADAPILSKNTFKFVAVNRAGKSAEATVTISIDMLEAFKAAVVGNWLVTNVEGRTTYALTVHADGSGVYTVDNVTYPTSWQIAVNRKGQYAFYEGGFWHPGFNLLERDGLTLPVRSFDTYGYNPTTGKNDTTALHYVKQ